MNPNVRKLGLILHIVASVGWLGAVAAFFVLAVSGLRSSDPHMVLSVYPALDLIGWRLIVPMSVASLLTGMIQSLGTEWGLFRHYWVLLKFIVSVGAMGLLLLHLQPADRLAQVTAATLIAGADLHGLRVQLAADAAAAVVVLLILTTVSLYKPWGLTRFGLRRQKAISDQSAQRTVKRRSAWGGRVLIGLAVLVLLALVVHVMGGGLGHHLK